MCNDFDCSGLYIWIIWSVADIVISKCIILYTSLGKYGILSFNNYKSIIVYLIFFFVIVSLRVFLFQLVKKDKKNIDIFAFY